MVTNAEIRKYIKKIRALFPVYSEKEKKYLLDLSESVDDFVRRTPQCTMEDVIEHFGSPVDVVYNYVESCDFQILITQLSRRQHLKKIVTIILVTTLVALGIYTAFLYKGYLDSKNTIITYSETVIEDAEE